MEGVDFCRQMSSRSWIEGEPSPGSSKRHELVLLGVAFYRVTLQRRRQTELSRSETRRGLCSLPIGRHPNSHDAAGPRLQTDRPPDPGAGEDGAFHIGKVTATILASQAWRLPSRTSVITSTVSPATGSTRAEDASFFSLLICSSPQTGPRHVFGTQHQGQEPVK